MVERGFEVWVDTWTLRAPLVDCMLGRYGGTWLARVGWPRVIIFFSIIIKIHKIKKKRLKLQVLSFMFTPNCRRCPLAQKLTSYVLNVSKSCTLSFSLNPIRFFG
ncbi:hypothetical protein Hanom_Chr09g00813731 [Helianthus anomalus]